MAQLPCTACLRRTPFRNSGVYFHLWGTGSQRDLRFRLCPGHLATLQHDLAKYELAPIDDTPSIISPPSECFSCRQPCSELDWNVALTVYPAKDEREDYWTRLHIDCTLPEWAQNGQPLL